VSSRCDSRVLSLSLCLSLSELRGGFFAGSVGNALIRSNFGGFCSGVLRIRAVAPIRGRHIGFQGEDGDVEIRTGLPRALDLVFLPLQVIWDLKSLGLRCVVNPMAYPRMLVVWW
jgi:hypothetical protein